MTKRCSLCGRDKDVEEFYCKGYTKAGQPTYAAQCKCCARRCNRAYDRRHKEARRAAWREYQRDRLKNPTIAEAERERSRQHWLKIKADPERHEAKKAKERERMRAIYADAKELRQKQNR